MRGCRGIGVRGCRGIGVRGCRDWAVASDSWLKKVCVGSTTTSKRSEGGGEREGAQHPAGKDHPPHTCMPSISLYPAPSASSVVPSPPHLRAIDQPVSCIQSLKCDLPCALTQGGRAKPHHGHHDTVVQLNLQGHTQVEPRGAEPRGAHPG